MDDFSTFEDELTPSVVRKLNECFRESWGSDDSPQINTRPESDIQFDMYAQRINHEPKEHIINGIINTKAFCLVALMLFITVIWPPFHDPAHLLRPPAVITTSTTMPLQNRTRVASELRNLALVDVGASILQEYTSPPSASNISNDILLDPTCVIRQPGSVNCWPLSAETAIGIDLGYIYNISTVRFSCQWGSLKPMLRDFSLYKINQDGTIHHLGTHKNSQEITLANAALVSRLILRIRCRSRTEIDYYGFLQSVEIMGVS